LAEPPERQPDNTNAEAPWSVLRRHAVARVGLGRIGVSLPTTHQLRLQLAHAEARDAVYDELDVPAMARQLKSLGLTTLAVDSAAPDRTTFLKRPDLGRRLSTGSAQEIVLLATGRQEAFDVVFVIADGLSANAVHRHAGPTLGAALANLPGTEWRVAPVVLVRQGRVAISDEIGALLGAELAVILLGERPGLSAPDSLGIYLTFGPQPGNSDAQRNCISNIHAAGQSHAQAADTLVYLMQAARQRRLSGIQLKDYRPAIGEAPLHVQESTTGAVDQGFAIKPGNGVPDEHA
jgi:ethanolamine ammonia-lyase small subunit